MEILKLRPFLDPKFEDVKRRWKQDYSKKYWVISLSQRERGKLIFTVLIDVFIYFWKLVFLMTKPDNWKLNSLTNNKISFDMKTLVSMYKISISIFLFFLHIC